MRLLLFLIVLPNLLFAQNNFETLKSTATQKDTHAVLACYELGKLLVGRSLDSSVMYLRVGAKLAEELDYTYGKIVSYRSLGSVEVRNGNYQGSLDYLEKGLRMIDSLELEEANTVDFLTNVGVAHYRVGLLGKAIETYIEAVDICREHQLDARRSRLLNNLGAFYRSLERYEEAMNIYQQSLELRQLQKDTMGMANTLFNISWAHKELGNPEQCIENLEAAEVFFRAIGSDVDILYCHILRASSFLKMGEYDKAINEFKKVLDVPNEEMESPFPLQLYLGMAESYLQKGNSKKAEYYLTEIKEEVLNSKLTYFEKNYYRIAEDLYKKMDRYKLACAAKDSLQSIITQEFAEDKLDFREEMETKYLSKEKDYQIELLNSERGLTALQLKSSRQRNIGLGIGLLLIAGFLGYRYRIYKKMESQNQMITKANAEKDVLLKEVHHRVKNNLQVVSSLLSMQSRFLKDESAIEAINAGKARVYSISLLHKNIYQNEDLKNINIKNYFKELCDNLIATYQLDEQRINFTRDIADLELDIDIVIPMGLITNELFSNSLKYAFPEKQKGNIHLAIQSENDQLILEVSDDGVGLPYDELPKRSKSLGLQLISSFAKKLHATINIDNSKGTSFRLEFKK